MKPKAEAPLVDPDTGDPIEPKKKPKDKDGDKAKADDAPTGDTFDFMIFDTTSKTSKRVAGYDGQSGIAVPAASPDGKRVAVGHATDAGQFLALVDTTTGKLIDVSVAPGGLNPAFSPDGSMVAYGDEGDIRLYHVAEGTVDELTKNPID